MFQISPSSRGRFPRRDWVLKREEAAYAIIRPMCNQIDHWVGSWFVDGVMALERTVTDCGRASATTI